MNHDETPLTDADAAFERQARERLAASTEALDGRTRSRLTEARFAALAELQKRSSRPQFRVPGRWLPAGALAGAAILALAVLIARPPGLPGGPVAEVSPVEDAEILASNDEPELYADDADFYEWAESEPGSGPG
jgi:hypothetical protein